MKIQIDGSGSINKGAQLMLAAVLQEVRQRFPNAKAIINDLRPCDSFIKKQFGSNFGFVRNPLIYRICAVLRIHSLTKKLSQKHVVNDVDIILDVGGFQFGDQWNHNDIDIDNWYDYLKSVHKKGAKIFFLPQAFGPFEKNSSKRMLDVIKQDADLIIARDDVSYGYLLDDGKKNGNIFLYPDFTTSVRPELTPYSLQNKDKVCIIPNSMIFRTGVMEKEVYITNILKVIEHVQNSGRDVTLLNHEGEGDYQLCLALAAQAQKRVQVVTGLDATETKGVISTSYLVISSRFHGVANALSCSVPCLATSWSHKYLKLLEEYNQDNCLLDLTDYSKSLSIIDNMLEGNVNRQIRDIINKKNLEVIAKNREMWDLIWEKSGLL